MQSKKKHALQFWQIFIAIIALIFLWILWETYKADNLGFTGKSLWDWMELLVVPAFLTLLALMFNKSQKETEIAIAEMRRNQDIKLAEQNAEVQREIEKDRQQQRAFEEYLNHMTDLLLNKKLRTSVPDDEIRSIARTRTITILRDLNGIRKSQILQFLYESSLIGKWTEQGYIDPIIDLSFADLQNVNLEYAHLGGISLPKSNLRNSNFYMASLIASNFYASDLDDANLSCTKLMGADLRAGLKKANLGSARLQKANLQDANLSGASLKNAEMTETNLKGANFMYKNRYGFPGDDLELASLTLANLTKADLNGAKINIKQLRVAKSLSGVTMPNGHRFEEWKQSHNLADDIDSEIDIYS